MINRIDAPQFLVEKFHCEIVSAGIPIEGVDEFGRIDFLPEATPEQRAEAEIIKAAHDPTDYEALAREAARARLNIADLDLLIRRANVASDVTTLREVVVDLVQIVNDHLRDGGYQHTPVEEIVP